MPAPESRTSEPKTSNRKLPIGALLLHLLQAAIYAAMARELAERWDMYGAALGLAALLQIGGAAGRLAGRPAITGAAGGLNVLLIAGLYGEVVAQALYMERSFGPQTAEAAVASLGVPALLLPWVFVIPLTQIAAWRAQAAPVLLLVGLLPGLRAWGGPFHGAPAEVHGAATALQQMLRGDDVTKLPIASLLTPVEVVPADGAASADGAADGAVSVAEAAPPINRRGVTVRIKADGVVPPITAATYLLDIPGDPIPGGLVRPGSDAPLRRPVSPQMFAREVKRKEIGPMRWAPQADASTRYSSWLVSAAGAEPVVDGWTAPPDHNAPGYGITPAAIDASVRAGADHLLANMQPGGRFTYIVKGPSGDPGRGYNYPRHAGTCWFLARAAAALGEPRYADAADAALGHLDEMSGNTADGRRYVLDPDRNDGKSWAGTTALAVMALSLRKNRPELLRGWVRQLAASVDADGKVRGEMDLKTGAFPEQPANPYGQGQVMLALATAERAGLTEGADALTRSIRYLESGGYAGSAYPLIVADEHWMCLTAHALRDVRKSEAADGICAAYAARERLGSPAPGGAIQPAAGPAGGLAEAIIAWAWKKKDGGDAAAWQDHSLRYGWLFLRSQYKESDAPLLGRPDRLIGGFRDTPGSLDVQIDAVQHIGSALLGVEALMSGRAREGSLP